VRIDVKPGVFIKVINDHFIAVCQIVWEEYQKQGAIPTLTAGADGAHMAGSYHYVGEAWDWRTWNLKDAATIFSNIRNRLEFLDPAFDTVWEGEGAQPHIHTEYDLKKGG